MLPNFGSFSLGAKITKCLIPKINTLIELFEKFDKMLEEDINLVNIIKSLPIIQKIYKK
jgi:hypothetical protein